MWIIPKTYQLSSAFAQDMVESKEDLTLPGLDIESSLMWRSKPTPLKTWQGRWKRVSWMQHLFTRILKPSHQKSFETKLASLLVDIPASHSQEQEKDREKKTLDTSGPQYEDTLNQLDLLDVCSKMSRDISRLDSAQSSAIWKKMVLDQRGEYSQRLKSEQDIREKEYSSWPTPTASAGGPGKNPDNSRGKHQGNALASAVRDAETWATPNTMDHLPPRSPEATEKMATGIRKGRKRPSNLREQVDPDSCAIYDLLWPTPRACDSTGGPVLTEYKNGFRSYRHDSGKWFGAKLKDAVEVFPTPYASEAEKYRLDGDSQATKCLSALARRGELEKFPTPLLNDYKGGYTTESIIRKDGKSRAHDQLCNAAIGGKGVDEVKGSLNPNWVEGLMGIPHGWTDLEVHDTDLGWKQKEDWLSDKWEEGIPRVVDGCDNRIDRIRLLGNGVVPSTACKAWQVLSRRLEDG